MIGSAYSELVVFAVSDRLAAFVASGELESEERHTFDVVVRTEADLASLIQAWRPVVDWYFDNNDEANDDEGFLVAGPVRTPRGLVFQLFDFRTPSVCLRRFVDLVNQTRLAGELDHLPETEFPRLRDDQIACRIDLDGDAFMTLIEGATPLPPGDPYDEVRGLPRWALPPARRQQLIDFMSAWCRLKDARLHLSADLITFPVTADAVAGHLRDAVQWCTEYTPVEVVAQTATAWRAVQFYPDSGVITFAVGGWPLTDAVRAEALAELRRVLVAMAPWSVYGRIRRAGPFLNPINDLEYGYGWPRPASNQIPASLPLRLITERGAVPDAFGIQLLHPSLAAADYPTDLRWIGTRLATGHLLLEHRNLEAWYADRQPDTEVIDQARTDLAALIRPTPPSSLA